MFAIVLIAGAQSSSFGQRAAPVPAKEKAARKEGAAASPNADPAAVRSRLRVIRTGGPDRMRATVMLGRPVCSNDFEAVLSDTNQGILLRENPAAGNPYAITMLSGTNQGILLRELIRQAVLIAARDELGATTRDEVLGESSTAASTGPELEVASSFRAGAKGRATIRSTGPQEAGMLLDQPLPGADLPALVETAELLSRTGFPALLKPLGLMGKANATRANAPLPRGVEERLAHLSYTELLAAIRDLHAAIRADGESPPRLAALARSYCLLGVLTEFLWHPAHKAFKARALLYSQRLVARNPNDPQALWNRALVRALVGMHVPAQSDLVLAQKQAQARGKKAAMPPDWVPLIDAYLRYDTKKLKIEQGPLSGRASLLHLLAVEFPRSKSLTIPAAQQVVSRNPDCFLAIDLICQTGGLSHLHESTVLGPQALERVVPAKLAMVEQLPARVRATIARRDEPALVEALRRAGAPGEDTGEPSWAVFGHLIAETRFVHVWRRLKFMLAPWAVPVDEYWAEARPLVAMHRYVSYLEALALPPNQARQKLTEFLAALDMNDLERKQTPLLIALRDLPDPRASYPRRFATAHMDRLAHDLAEAAVHFPNDSGAYAQELLVISPNSPFGRATLIERNWERAQPLVAEWQKDPVTGDAPALLAALARQATKAGQIDDAQHALERYIRQAPEYWAYEMLAKNYKTRNDLTRWKSTLEEFLQRGEDPGLAHARVQVEIARYFMELQQWDEAKPYAEAAAENSGAGWAMLCAAECNEALGEFDRAEYWCKNQSERYPGAFLEWFLFCKRTGHGDVAAATQLAKEALKQASGPRVFVGQVNGPTLFYDLTNEPAQGLAYLQRLAATPAAAQRAPAAAPSIMKAAGAPLEGPPVGQRVLTRFPIWVERLYLAYFADALDDEKLRDEFWAQVAASGPSVAARSAALFREALDPGAKPFDRKVFEALLASTDSESQAWLRYFAGRFLQRHGKIEDVVSLWERYTMVSADGWGRGPQLCNDALRTYLNSPIPADSHRRFLRSQLHRATGRTDLALKDLDVAIRLDPHNLEALNMRAIVKRSSGDLDGALLDFSKLIEMAPKDQLGYSGRGVTYVLLSRDAEAAKDIEQAIALAPKSGSGLAAKGILFLARGKEAEAEASFAQALALDESIRLTIQQLKKAVKQKRGAH
jgi:tetratricopeptide (TPR) repeat protein